MLTTQSIGDRLDGLDPQDIPGLPHFFFEVYKNIQHPQKVLDLVEDFKRSAIDVVSDPGYNDEKARRALQAENAKRLIEKLIEGCEKRQKNRYVVSLYHVYGDYLLTPVALVGKTFRALWRAFDDPGIMSILALVNTLLGVALLGAIAIPYLSTLGGWAVPFVLGGGLFFAGIPFLGGELFTGKSSLMCQYFQDLGKKAHDWKMYAENTGSLLLDSEPLRKTTRVVLSALVQLAGDLPDHRPSTSLSREGKNPGLTVIIPSPPSESSEELLNQGVPREMLLEAGSPRLSLGNN